MVALDDAIWVAADIAGDPLLLRLDPDSLISPAAVSPYIPSTP
jgi:hypothetical protein